MDSKSCTNTGSGESVSPFTIMSSVPCRWQKVGKPLEAEADQPVFVGHDQPLHLP
jgi:hypothetical protein